jgi:hypothetical protein
MSESLDQEKQGLENDLNSLLTDITAVRAVLAGILSGSATWDAASISDGDMESKDITVTGAAIGDFVLVSMGVDVVDLGVSAQVTATNTVTVTLLNNTGGAVDLASTTCRVRVLPQASFAAPAALNSVAGT